MKTRTTTTTITRAVPILFACLPLVMPPALAKDKKAPAATALVSGSVFREPGFALRGASVAAAAAEPGKKKQEWKAVTSARGEFVLRLPPGPASYNVVVSAAGMISEQKTVTLAGDENIELSFLLKASPGEGQKQ